MREQEIRQYYEQWWENPRDPRGVVFEKLGRIVEQRLPPGQGKRALDLGAGKGRIVEMLRRKGYRVTAVDLHPGFLDAIKARQPDVETIQGDVREVALGRGYDLITAVELLQNLEPDTIPPLLQRLTGVGARLVLTLSNPRSFHGWWVRRHRFQADFVHLYGAAQTSAWLRGAGWRLTHCEGAGLLTPVTRRPNFEGRVVPVWLARGVNALDRWFGSWCHEVYLEAEVNR